MAAGSLVVSACGGGDIQETAAPEDGTDCGDFNIAINPWVGYEASAHVVGYVAATELGCNVEYKSLKEEVAWQGFGSGEVDVVIENWGHDDLKAKYIDEQGTAQDAGPNGNIGVIGWFLPPWMVEEYPDITEWENLNKYAEMFRTSESGDNGQLLDGDPSFVTNDEALVQNLDLNFTVVYAGSEPALIQAFRQAEENREPLLGYFYAPQWFLSQVPLVKVNLPPYTEGCDADPEAVACDYPEYILDKIVATSFAES
ncbi:MAG: glycine/betaine ABC transporter substrate-binding protein, partial [Geodermatophilaceae bacterium]|nr:glycine/betaine ABC transporter substrate-binding protein [Geodermatophilaceae bacterium]